MASLVVYTMQPILAIGIKDLLASDPSITVTACPTSVDSLKATMFDTRPDLALLDVTPEMTRMLLGELQNVAPECKIILWTENMTADFALQALTVGVRGVLRKTLPLSGHLQCIQRVEAGGLWFEKSLTDRFRAARRVTLSPREGQLVNLLSRGMKNKEISHELGITEGTVKVYLSHLFQKSGAKDRFELAVYGLQNMGMSGAGSELLSSLVMEPQCRA